MLSAGGAQHRLEVTEVRRGDHHLGSDYDLLLVGGGLCVSRDAGDRMQDFVTQPANLRR